MAHTEAPAFRWPIQRLILAAAWLLLLSAAPRAGETTLALVGGADLLAKTAGGLVPMPLLNTDVELTVTGVMVRGVIEQRFLNPEDGPIEALYVFPLPERAAVHAMEMRIGDRRIVAVVREREEAKAVYEAARKEGRKAGLLEQQRPNLFTTSVTGINPGEAVTVRMEYLQEADWRDGEFSTVFPLTFTPRYFPGAASAGSATSVTGGDPARLSGTAFLPASVARVPEASLRVRFDGGFHPSRVTSPTHVLHERRVGGATLIDVIGIGMRAGQANDAGGGSSAAPAEWSSEDMVAGTSGQTAGGPTGSSESEEPAVTIAADRDFVLRWSPRLEAVPTASLFIEDREDGRYGLLMILPPVPQSDAASGLPTDTVFVVDTSGSMDGPSIVQAREALQEALGRLRPGDGFDIVRFASDWEAFRPQLARSPDAVEEAVGWVRGLKANGGTEIVAALVAALRLAGAPEPGRARRVILLTDGAVGNEDEAFRTLAPLLGDIRLHVIGIGTAPNAYLMARLAHLGRGACDFIHTPEEVRDKTDAFLERLDRPVLTDVVLDWRGAPPIETQPADLPDLYAGEPLFVSLRLGLGHPGTRGELRGQTHGGEIRIPIEVGDDGTAESGIAFRWARAKVGSLMESGRDGENSASVRGEVVALAKEFTLVTPWTSLVAVEERPSVEGLPARRGIPNALPAGSQPCGGTLPQGGTLWPLLTGIGVILFGTGVTLLVMLRGGRLW